MRFTIIVIDPHQTRVHRTDNQTDSVKPPDFGKQFVIQGDPLLSSIFFIARKIIVWVFGERSPSIEWLVACAARYFLVFSSIVVRPSKAGPILPVWIEPVDTFRLGRKTHERCAELSSHGLRKSELTQQLSSCGGFGSFCSFSKTIPALMHSPLMSSASADRWRSWKVRVLATACFARLAKTGEIYSFLLKLASLQFNIFSLS